MRLLRKTNFPWKDILLEHEQPNTIGPFLLRLLWCYQSQQYRSTSQKDSLHQSGICSDTSQETFIGHILFLQKSLMCFISSFAIPWQTSYYCPCQVCKTSECDLLGQKCTISLQNIRCIFLGFVWLSYGSVYRTCFYGYQVHHACKK